MVVAAYIYEMSGSYNTVFLVCGMWPVIGGICAAIIALLRALKYGQMPHDNLEKDCEKSIEIDKEKETEINTENDTDMNTENDNSDEMDKIQ